MTMQDLYDQWEERVTARGRAQGEAEGRAQGKAEELVRTLIATYEARFGSIPEALRLALPKHANPEATERWVGLFVTGSAEAIAAALHNGNSV